MIDQLFEPLVINGLNVKNRIYMPAMHLQMCRNFEVTDQLVEFYTARACGGAGIITVGYATVDELSGNPTNIGAHRDEYIPGLARLARAIRENGAAASVQLNHAGRYNHSLFLGGKQPVAPSAIPSRLTRETPHALDAAGIARIIAGFAQAALRVKTAGFDAVEILAGTGYLISEFLSEVTNKRIDDYGGSLENRMRFGLEVLRAVRESVGPAFPLVVRMNGNDFMKGGTGRRELQEFARCLVAAGTDAICVNVGWHEALVPQIVTKVPRGVFAYLARGVKEAVHVPVIASHRINDPAVARDLIADGMCDMVAMGRALIADPALPEKTMRGKEREIVHCVACGQGCFDNLFKMKPVECLCNPRAGHERETVIERAAKSLKVMVVGGGAAGMTAAAAAADAGHQVTLFERSGRLGGQLHLAGAPPGREEFLELARDLACQLDLRKVRVVLNQEVDEAVIEREQPDAVILATGGMPVTPPIPGANLPNVVQAWDILAGKVRTGKRVAIVGGGAVGVETALLLAEKGTLSGEELKFLLVHGAEAVEDLGRLAVRGTKEVILVEMLDGLGNNFGKSTRWGMLMDVERYGVIAGTAVKVLEITAAGLRVERDGNVEDIAADTVVLAVGTRPYNPLQEILAKRGIPHKTAGDALQAAMVFDAVHQGFAAGREIV
ncbi:oxidoreductase [Geotalea uraniireducens]|uniref:NADH:flavin oxidoreductase/NADH oxidase n=1 Tax=Geotalea uraniireducens (strain Rf4) TaxID=351605 RepID=A5GED6_GEOUR|nr:FAD-dependent oxidoreductase [Geotalea uraniireducens]ABQ25791.1 NADH:flavin oxidoreductase/NADH oxidase [Geotalea uraniireducens Rf4]